MRQQRASGVVLVVVSALVFSTAGIFTKGVVADAWVVVFWRGLAAAGFTLAYLLVRGQLWREMALFRGPALLVTVLGASGTVAFIPAFKLTSVANVALIYAAAPFITAVLAWLFIAEKPSRVVVIASVAAFGGVCFIVSGSIGGGGLVGDALALWMTLMMAGMMVVYRRWPGTTVALPAALSSLLLLPVALVFGEPLVVPEGEMPVLILFGLVFAIASVTFGEGARRLPPTEVALLSALETPLAPVWAFLVLAEVAGLRTIVGGVVIMVAVVGSQVVRRWDSKGESDGIGTET